MPASCGVNEDQSAARQVVLGEIYDSVESHEASYQHPNIVCAVAHEHNMKYRKKPVVIEAIRWDGENLDEVMNFCNGDASYELMARGSSELVIATLEDGESIARHVASVGDFIIKGVSGEFYPCKPDIFDKTYEAAE